MGATCFTALWLCVAGRLGEGTVPLPGFWRFAWPSPCFQLLHPLPVCDWHPSSSCPDADSQSGWGCVVLSLCGLLKWSVLKIQQFLPLPQTPLVFTARSYRDLSSWPWNPWRCSLAWDRLLPRYSLVLLSTICECGAFCGGATATHSPPNCVSGALRPSPWLCPSYPSRWMWLFKILGCLTSIQLDFLMVLNVVLRSCCNSFCGCMRRFSVSAYTSILTRSRPSF